MDPLECFKVCRLDAARARFDTPRSSVGDLIVRADAADRVALLSLVRLSRVRSPFDWSEMPGQIDSNQLQLHTEDSDH